MHEQIMKPVNQPLFFNRDLSWLSFNARVLAEAQRSSVPVMERLRFLSIFSSNLDEFYRVRMPALLALDRVGPSADTAKEENILPKINAVIRSQQVELGRIISEEIIGELARHKIKLLLDEILPVPIAKETETIFFQEVAGFIQIVELTRESHFFPENNKLYLLVKSQDAEGVSKHFVLNIPSDHLPRFYSISRGDTQYIVFQDDIIKANLYRIFRESEQLSSYSFKITRDAELDLKDEFEGNLAKKIEREISRRDFGLATRFLYDAAMPTEALYFLTQRFGLKKATLVMGGVYHNLKDLASLPLKNKVFYYDAWPRTVYQIKNGVLLFDYLRKNEILLHPPYHAYDTVLRFFNEAAIDIHVTRIYVTLYRVANDSRIANALINAARNGKKVTVFVELKARFDEANNIKWAKKMKEAGVRIIVSIPSLKVHAKIALVKRNRNRKSEYFGLLSTGNFNENTARFYADHILITSNKKLLQESERLFRFLKKRKIATGVNLRLKHLLIAQFNLQRTFVELIDREISNARKGLPAAITLKMNNLEETVLIKKLYEASQAGVNISLIVRGISCLVPGVTGLSENIRLIRIIDRFLEHARVFIFNNNDKQEVFLGSADWMIRNIYRRIEVCFPIYDRKMKAEIMKMTAYQLQDNTQAVMIDHKLNNLPAVRVKGSGSVRSQKAISEMISASHKRSNQSKS